MKKNHAVKLVLAAVLAVAMVAGVGCSSDSGTTEGETTEETGETGEETGEEETPNLVILDTAYAVEDYAICVAKENTDLLEQINGALAELKEEGTLDKIVAKYISGEDFTLELAEVPEGADNLIMGTNAAFPPYEYYEDETIVGIDAEIAAAIANKLGMNLLIEDMEFGSIIAAVQSGKIDFGAAGMTVTEDRLANVNFTDSYATGIQSIIVTGDSVSMCCEACGTGKPVFVFTGRHWLTRKHIRFIATLYKNGYAAALKAYNLGFHPKGKLNAAVDAAAMIDAL